MKKKSIRTKVSGFEFELRNINVIEEFSEETTAFEADAYLNGKHLGVAWNEGHGGPTFLPVREEDNDMVDDFNDSLSSFKKNIVVCEKQYTLVFDMELLIDVMVAKSISGQKELNLAEECSSLETI